MNDTISAALPAVPPRFDFPTWLPPMLVKELRQGLRQRGFVGGLIVAQLVLVIVFITGFASDTGNGSSRGMIDGVFWGTMFGTLLVGAPMRALIGLSAELDARTMDLLLLTRLDAWRIVWGKWVSLMVQTLLLVVTLLPYAVVRYFFGSVDLVSDFETIVTMLGFGAVLTGAGLWMSGLPRVPRALAVAAAVFLTLTSMGGVMSRGVFGSSGGGIFSASAGSVSAWLMWVICFWCGAWLLAYTLMMAVRWFAPPAENHAIGPRIVPLLLALPAVVLALNGNQPEAAAFAAIWLVVLAGVAGIELAGTREVMAIHLRGWLGCDGWRRVVGAMFLPGWPSACAWLAAMLGLVAAVWGVADMVMAEDLHAAGVLWLLVLAWTGLVFPILLISLVPTVGRVAGVLYFILHAVLGIFAVMAGSDGLGRMAPTSMRVMDWISHAVPTTSFWHALVEFEKPSELPAVEFGQAVGVSVTLAFMLWLARPYWTRVLMMRRRPVARVGGEGA